MPPATATAKPSTKAVIEEVMLDKAEMLPLAELSVAPVITTATPRPVPPMSLRASDAPTETPIPIAPTPKDSAAAITLASMLAAPTAEMSIPVCPASVMLSMLTRVSVEMVLLLSAPAPLTARPPIPKPAANATEAARDRIVALSLAATVNAPVVAVTEPAAPLAALRMT